MKNYRNEIADFSKQLGVLPIYFMHNQQDDSKYVLLNGEKNNFCIDFKNEFDENLYRSYAWSANVNNFLSIKEDKCLLYSINDKEPEIINYRTMTSHLSKFYDYLGTKNTNRNETVISYILKTYRQLRNALRETSGNDSLRAFLYLLSSIESDNIILDDWGLSEQSKSIANTISNSLWEEFVSELRNGIINEN